MAMPVHAPRDAPLRQFRGSHDAILQGLREMRGLPALAAAVQRARTCSDDLLRLFDRTVLPHHRDEEEELFPAVLRSCRDAAERERVQTFVHRLTGDHRRIEQLWEQVRPAVVHTAAGKAHGEAFTANVEELVRLYGEHVQCEEDEFLPLAGEILARNPNHVAALDLSLHLRHAPLPRAYV